MAASVVLNFPSAMTREEYDRVHGSLDLEANPPDGLLVHTAGAGPTGWRVIDIWESGDHFMRFAGERLQPTIQSLGIEGEVTPEICDLYNVWTPRADDLGRMGASVMPSVGMAAS
jgi:hypothetical protein